MSTIKNITIALCLLVIPVIAIGKTLGDIATDIEQKIYSTMPKDQAEALFKRATAYATKYLSRDLVKEQRTSFATSFASSYVRHFAKSISPELKRRLTTSHLESMTTELQKTALNILDQGEERQLNAVQQALPQCTSSLKSDMITLFVVGEDETFTANSTMPNTASCLIKESNINQIFADELRPHQFEFANLLLQHLRKVLKKEK